MNKIYSVPAMKPVGAGDSLTPVNNNLRRGIVYQQPEGDQPEMVESAVNVEGNKPARAAWDVFNDFAK